MRFTIFLIIVCIIAALCSCSKQDLQHEAKMFRVSKWHDLNWKFRDSTLQEVAYNLELLKYRDTTVFPITCPLSGIEIRYYLVR